MAMLTVNFDEMGGITEFNGLSVQDARALIINKAADYLDKFRFFNAGIDNYTDYSRVEVIWLQRVVKFPIVLN